MKALVPSYFYPGPIWDRLLKTDPNVLSDVIVNPASGPGTAPDTEYEKVVSRAKKKGITVLGYVATTYGKKPIDTVTREIERTFAFYAVDGIFLDEVDSAPATIPDYYKQLYDAIRGKVVLNHGRIPDEGYCAVGDVLVVFEGTGEQHRRMVWPLWMKNHPSSQFCHIIHSVPNEGEMKAAVNRAKCNANNIYITNDVEIDAEKNPYNSLPQYWEKLVAECVK